MFLILIVATLPDLVVEIKYGRQVWGIHGSKAELRRKYWELRRHFFSLKSLVELKLFQNIGHFLSMVKELFISFRGEQKKAEKQKLIYQLIALILSHLAIAFAIVWFINEVVQGNLLVGTLTFILTSIADLRQALSSLFVNLSQQYQDSLFVIDTFKILDLKPVIPKSLNAVTLNPNKTPEIIFDNVSFAYPGSGKNVLENFSLTIPAGCKLAIIGVNGAGKTTFVKLLCRFMTQLKGEY